MSIERNEDGARCVRHRGYTATALIGGWWHVTYEGKLVCAWVTKNEARAIINT